MVMSACFNNLNLFGQFLCPGLGDRSHHQSLKSYNQQQAFSLKNYRQAIIFSPQATQGELSTGNSVKTIQISREKIRFLTGHERTTGL
jgi:hypothetical protein